MEGRLHDDPFWGYGKITRTALASVAARDALCEDLKKSVHAHVNNVRDKLKAAYDQDAASLQAHREALAAAERKVLDNGRAQLIRDQACQKLFAEGVEINRRIRGRDVVLPDWTRNPPSYANLLRDLRPGLVTLRATVEAAEAVHRPTTTPSWSSRASCRSCASRSQGVSLSASWSRSAAPLPSTRWRQANEQPLPSLAWRSPGAMLLMGGGAVAVGALNQSPPRDHRNCRIGEPLKSSTVLMADATDTLTEIHRARLARDTDDLLQSTPVDGKV